MWISPLCVCVSMAILYTYIKWLVYRFTLSCRRPRPRATIETAEHHFNIMIVSKHTRRPLALRLYKNTEDLFRGTIAYCSRGVSRCVVWQFADVKTFSFASTTKKRTFWWNWYKIFDEIAGVINRVTFLLNFTWQGTFNTNTKLNSTISVIVFMQVLWVSAVGAIGG